MNSWLYPAIVVVGGWDARSQPLLCELHVEGAAAHGAHAETHQLPSHRDDISLTRRLTLRFIPCQHPTRYSSWTLLLERFGFVLFIALLYILLVLSLVN